MQCRQKLPTLAFTKFRIMKKIILFVFVAMIGYTVNAQANIKFDKDAIDYGTIEKGSDGVRVFTFTNTGNKDLIIGDVKSSCGCTVPEKPKGPVKPGATAEIKVKYDTNRVGPIRKTITVYSNAADDPIKALKIKGEVLADGKSVLEKTN